MADISATRDLLFKRLETLEDKAAILRAPELKQLYGEIRNQPENERREFGAAVNALKEELQAKVSESTESADSLPPIDVTAPFDVNASLPALLPSEQGTVHPLMREMQAILDIFYRMGFNVSESREIDDQ